MSYETSLRNALRDAKDGKDKSREAGSGVWANYVRSTCYPEQPVAVETLDAANKTLISVLNDIKPLDKDEKNSLRSAKCVVAKAIKASMDVWQRDASGFIKTDELNLPMPKGKSELQESKTDAEKMIAGLDVLENIWNKDARDVFTTEELETIWGKMALLADAILQEKNSQE